MTEEALHSVIAGDSREGKTTLLAQIHVEFQGPSIIIKTKETDSFKGKEGSTGEGLVSAFENADKPENLKVVM
jgi:uridine kinase